MITDYNEYQCVDSRCKGDATLDNGSRTEAHSDIRPLTVATHQSAEDRE